MSLGTQAQEMHRDRVKDDEISLGDLVRGLWATRGWAVAGSVAGLAVATIIVLTQAASTPGVSSFRQDVELTLDDTGTYPNGTPFSANDLRSPVVLQRVYDEAGLSEYGFDYRQFAASITVTPASASYGTIVNRYRDRLNESGLTSAERQQIEAEFNAALSSALSSGATIAFTLPTDISVPPTVGQHVVSRIPDAWADIFINQLGVLDLPVPGSTGDLVTNDAIAALDYPIAYDALETAFDTLGERILLAQAVPGAQNLNAPETGRTLFDISRNVDALRRYSLEHVLAPMTELGLHKSPEITLTAYQYQVETLDRQMRLASDNAAIIDEALRTAGGGAGAPVVSEQASGDGAVQLPTTIVQQFGPELVDRLIGMSVENAGIGFRESLLETKLAFEAQALELGVQRDRLQQRISIISGQRRIENQAVLETVFAEEASRLVDALNGYWDEVGTILARANFERLNHDKQLFRALPVPEIVPDRPSLFSRSNIMLLVALGLSGLLIGIGGFALRRTVRR